MEDCKQAKTLIRVSTVPQSLRILLKGQLKFMTQYYKVLAVSSDGDCFDSMIQEQEVSGKCINMTRQITPLKDLVALFKLIILFIKEKPFIVHTHTPKAGILGMLAAWMTCVPNRLHTVAGLPLLEASGQKRRLLNFVEKLTYSCATNIYPNSFVMKDIIIANKLAHADKLKVIGNGSSNGIDTSFFSRDQVGDIGQTIIKELEITSDVFTFCFVGRLVKDKGISELVQSFVRLNSEFPNTCLLLVGNFERDLDPLSDIIENLIFNCRGIKFMNYQDDVRPFFAASDALVFPSYREGFPNVVMQAGAMGLPSIVTDINGCNEIIVEGQNGVLIPPKDIDALYKAMKYFIEHRKDEVLLMTKNARVMIENRFEQTEVWKAILKEYQSLENN